MLKTKSDVERILEKIEGEIKTAEKEIKKRPESFEHEYTLNDYEKNYFDGKKEAFTDIKTWIQENILEEK